MKKSGLRMKRKTATVKKVVNQVLNKKIETKKAFLGEDDLTAYHNAQISLANLQPIAITNLFNVWAGIVPGVADNNRVGNEIEPRGIKLKMYFENGENHPNVHYRLIIGYAPKQRSDGAATTPTNLELLAGAVGNNLLRISNVDLGYKIIHDKVYRNVLGIATVNGVGNIRTQKYVSLWLKPKKGSKIVYNGATFGATSRIVNNPFFACLIPYDTVNTSPSIGIAKYSYQCILYYKDV